MAQCVTTISTGSNYDSQSHFVGTICAKYVYLAQVGPITAGRYRFDPILAQCATKLVCWRKIESVRQEKGRQSIFATNNFFCAIKFEIGTNIPELERKSFAV
jgi:hypothetical protein